MVNTTRSSQKEFIWLLPTMVIGLMSGCSSNQPIPATTNEVAVADFAKHNRKQDPVIQDRVETAPSDIDRKSDRSAPEALDNPRLGAIAAEPTEANYQLPKNETHTIDAMVGHVNGQPIYANVVFEPIQEQLAALGKSQPPKEFHKLAQQLIVGRLQQLVVDALILGEAERDLSNQEQAGLLRLLAQKREEFIRFWGRGSVAVAEENITRETGKTLDETINDSRQRMLVQRYLRQKLFPKINITRKDIERHYQEKSKHYNPPPVRVLRLIRTRDPVAANSIDAMLAINAPFAEVANTKANTYRPNDGGLMSNKAIGASVFGSEALNAALADLKAGEHSGRIKDGDSFWWIHVESQQQDLTRSLKDAQLEIEDLLRRRRFQQLTQEYRRELIKTGSYSSIEEMGRTLLDIAMARYASNR